MNTNELAHALRDALALRHPPVALAFVTEAPDGVEAFSGAVPSACTFWRRCEEKVFFAPADAHFNCPIGALTMGFSMAPAQEEKLFQLVGKMGELCYLDPDEAPNVPSVPGDKNGIVYGPLEGFPLDPDVVLVWVTAVDAMLLDEATGAGRWTPEQTGTATFGRPSCAAIPMSVTRGAPTFSVGCAGMRTFTGIEDDLELAVLPRAALPLLAPKLAEKVSANAQMRELYIAQKSEFEDGPTSVALGTGP